MKICVIGTGTMAKGIVKAFAAKMPIVMKSRTQASIDKAMDSIAKSYAKLVEKGKMTQEAVDALLANITTTTDYATFADADLVIEAAVEEMQLKKDVFVELDKICKPETIFATNSSSLSITEIAACTQRPAQFIGMHFFNPADRMALVEVIRGQLTSDEVCKCVIDLATSIGKQPVEVKEAPGFVVNRILIPMINEAVGILADGIATAEDIDKCMMLGANHPMGPLALADLIGKCSTKSSATPNTVPIPCSARWSAPASSAAKPARVSTNIEPLHDKKESRLETSGFYFFYIDNKKLPQHECCGSRDYMNLN